MSLEEVEVYLTPDLRGRAGIVREAEGRYRIWLVRVGEQLNTSSGPESYGSLNEARAYLKSLPEYSNASQVSPIVPKIL